MNEAAEVIAALTRRGQTLATAESLTGGMVCAALTSIPGSSAVVRGGIVAYATALKHQVLNVDAELLRRGGAVQAEVAEQLAEGVRQVLRSDWGVGTTGVAGPAEQDGKAVGTVFVAVSGPSGTVVRDLLLNGDREQIRAGSVAAALRLLATQCDPE